MCLFPRAIHTLSITSRIGFCVFAGTALPKYTRQIGDSLWGSWHRRAAFLHSVGGPLEFAEWGRERGRGRRGYCSRSPFVRGNTGLEDATVRPVTEPASRESAVFHCKVSAVTFWLRGSCEEGGKCTDSNIWKTLTRLSVANIMNDVSRPIIFDCTPLDPYCRCCSTLASLCDSQSTCAPDCAWWNAIHKQSKIVPPQPWQHLQREVQEVM